MSCRKKFTTGFFSAEARAAGETTPEWSEITATDLSRNASCSNQLNRELQIGKFALPWALARAIRKLPLHSEDASFVELCERGVRIFLRGVLLQAGYRLHYAWPEHVTPRTCERFGEAFATFAHYDVRLSGFRMFNAWVPINPVDTSPLLFFAANPDVMDGAWKEPTPKARHVAPTDAMRGDWYFFGGLDPGSILVFPGDGGVGPRGLFHGSALAEDDTRRWSFDVRELVTLEPARPAESDSEDESRKQAVDRHEREVAALDADLVTRLKVLSNSIEDA